MSNYDNMTVRKRLDSIIETESKMVFTRSIKNGWTTYLSSTGLKIAIIELDHPAVWSKEVSTYLGGKMLTTPLQENAPTGFFNFVFHCDVKSFFYTQNDFRIQMVPKLMCSKDYTGVWDAVLTPIGIGFGPTDPDSIHAVYTMIGF